MRRWLGVLTGLLLCSVAHAEIINVTPAGSGGGGGSFPPTGCVTANGIVFNNATPCDAQFTYTGASGTGQVQIGGGTLAAGANTVFTINPASASGLLLDAQVGGVSQWKVSSAGVTTQLGGALFSPTNAVDIGTNATTLAPRTVYAGTSFVGPAGTFTTSVAIGGATIGSNALAVTGTALISGNTTIGSGGTGALNIGLNLDGGSATNGGPYIAFRRNSVTQGYVGTTSGVVGGGLNDTMLYGAAGNNVYITPNAAGTGSVILGSPGVQATTPGALTLSVTNVVAGGTNNVAAADFTQIASLATGNAANGKFVFRVGLTGASGNAQASPFPLLTLNPGAAGTATVQFGDGTNFTTYDNCTALTTGATGVIACTASAARFKNIYQEETVSPREASLALDKLRVGAPVWDYRRPEMYGKGKRVGVIADDVERMDPRCIVKRDGEVADYWDRCVIAYLVADRQAMKAEIEALKQKAN